MKFDMILATDEKNGIGKSGSLAWKIKKDMEYFKNVTTETKKIGNKNAVIMGYKTWISIPEKFRPLPNRINCVITNSLEGLENRNDVLFFENFNNCLNYISNVDSIESVFVIGGASLYNSVLDDNNLNEIYLTKVKGDFDCDVFFAGIPNDFILESESEEYNENGTLFKFCVYKKYLD